MCSSDLTGDEPGVGLLIGVLAFGRGEIQLTITGHQFERVATPVAGHVTPRLEGKPRFFGYVSINSEITVACPEVVTR